MKIGLLTFNQTANIGTLAQAYCAFKLLEETHPDASVRIIDYEPWSRIRYRLREAVPAISFKKKSINFNGYLGQKSARQFLKKYCRIDHISFFHGLLRTEDSIATKNYDVIYTGSDTVWMHHSSRLPNIPSLYYLPKTLGKAERRAISVSIDPCASDADEFMAKQVEITNALNAFSLISVRDENTEDFVSRFCEHRNYIRTIDPTLLYDFEKDFNLSYSEGATVDPNSNIMLWAEASDMARIAKDLSDYNVTLGQGGHRWLQNPIVEEINNMMGYSAIITDRFHRAILTIKTSGRCVIIVEGCKKYPNRGSKSRDLFQSLGLNDYVVRGDTLKNDKGQHISQLLKEWDTDRAERRRINLFKQIKKARAEFDSFFGGRREYS